jgi:hypothetical protein
MTIVQKPGFIPKDRNIVKSDAPITISGVAIGRNIRRLVADLPLNEYLPIAKAMRVPKTVAIKVDSKPIFKELPRALHTSGAPQGFFQLFSVKPRQTILLFIELLNEKRNVYPTGINR